ncbi:MAG: aminotransferase class V-fold PLP-dependent enzyme, partial [Chloroflexota bacterium]
MSTSTHLTLDPVAIRAEFPLLQADANGNRITYLDSAASSQKPEAVIQAIDRYYRNDNANVHRGVYKLAERSTEAYENARAQVARYFHVDDDGQIVFTRNTTEAINLVAASWGRANLGTGDRILFSVMEHHSNLVPWQLTAQQTGADLGFIDIDDRGRLSLDSLDQHLDEGDVKIVALGHVSNMLGVVNPVEQIIERAHRAGAVVLLDGAQAAPHRPVDLPSLGVDFYACSAHKMCGPMGIGMLYGRRELLEAMPPYMGGGEMIRVVELERSTYADIPAKFEAGTPSVAD